MTPTLHVEKLGQGPAMVLIHGWGLNSAVWDRVARELSQQFTIYCIDLPGFGYSHQVSVNTDISVLATQVVAVIKEPAIWMGWSLGGLVATQIALQYPAQVSGLITVASSPKFSQAPQWPGIKEHVMTMFTQQLEQDFVSTLERFLAIQAMGSDSEKQDIKTLKKILSHRPLPNKKALHWGLEVLKNVDLRTEISLINVPFLRIYGRLDSLVPKQTISLINDLSHQSEIYTFEHASHAPFISHRREFIDVIYRFMKKYSSDLI